SLYSTASSTAINTGSGTSASATVSPTSTTSYYFVFTDTGVSSGATPASAATVSTNKVTVTVNTKPVVSISPSTAVIDVGQSILLTPSISGGSGSFSYAWYIGGNSAVVGSKSTYSFSSSKSGNYFIYLNVTDNVTSYVFSSKVSITVDSSLTVSLQPSSSTIDLGQTVTLTSKVSGGTGSYSWSLFTSGGTLVSSGTGNSASYSVKPTANTSYYFVFTDSGVTSGSTPQASVNTNQVVITVNSDPTVTVLPVTIGSGSSATLTATASGGSKTGYTFKWYSTSSLTTLVYSGNPFVTPVLTATTVYYVTVTDSTGTSSAPASVTVTVVGGLTSSSLSITPTTTDLGYSISVNVASGSGVPPFSYTWTITLSPSGSASGDYTTSSNTVTFTKVGVYTVTATVRDSSGETASISKVVTVNALPSVSLTPSTATVDVGNTITFTNSTTGGTGTITFSWGYPSGAGITRSGNQFTFSSTGNFTIRLYANDSLGASSFGTATVSVNSQPIIVYSSLNVTISTVATMDSGTSTSIVVKSISGNGPYTAQLEAEAPGATTYTVIASTNQFSSLPESIGTGVLSNVGQWHFVVSVTEVSNSGIFGTSSPVTINVVNALDSSALSISPTTTDIGVPVAVTVQSGYGTAPFLYSWSVTTTSGASAAGDYSSSGNQITFSVSGTYSVIATVTDADGLTASTSASITVNSQLTVTISATSPTEIDLGQTVTFTNSVSGGNAPYSISYSVSPVGGGIVFGAYSVSGNVITFTLAGQYVVTSTVTDSLKNTATSTNSVTVTVNPLPTIAISPSSKTIDSGNNVTFTNTTSGGTKPYTYIWSYPSGVGITQSGNNFRFNDTGNFTITLTIVDAVGIVASASANITVNPSPIIVLQPVIPSGATTANFTINGYVFETTLKEQKKTLSGGSIPTITLDENTPWSVYVRAGTGTPPFSFTWTVLTSTGSNATDYTLSSSNSTYIDNVIDFTGIGSYSVTIKVTDKYGATSSESVNINVNSPLLVVKATVKATPSSFDLGGSVVLTSTPKIYNGTPPYYFQWYRNGTSGNVKLSNANGSVTSNETLSVPFAPTVPGVYTFYLVIYDSAYSPASNSTTVTVTVNKVPTTSSLNISPTSTIEGGLINASVSPGFGTAPFNFTWTVTPQGSSTPTTYYGNQLALSQPGNYSVSLKLRDADGNIAYNNTTLRIYSSSLIVVKISSPTTQTVIDVGESQVVTGTFSGGSGSYEYEWEIQTSPVLSPPTSGFTVGSSPQSYNFVPSSPGTYYIYLYVKDTIVGDVQGSYAEVTVNNDLTQSSITVSPTSTTTGSPVTASVSPKYGTPPFKYTWTVTLINGGSATGDYSTSGNQIIFSNSGNYTVKVTVSDSFSSATSTSYNIFVSAVVRLTASISTYPSAGITAIDIKHALEFEANVAGGSGTISYSWGLSGVSGSVSTSSTYTLNATTPGLYIIYLNVTEGTSHTSAAPITVIVNPLPSASFGGSTTVTVDVGQTINAVVVGGTPRNATSPYTYSWTVTIYPSGGSAVNDYRISGSSITFTNTGNYTVDFSATDSDNAVASISAQFVVNSPLSSTLSLVNPISSIIDRGNSTVLNVSITGGSGFFSYQWYEQMPDSSSFVLVLGAHNSTYDFITSNLTTPGIYLFYVNVTDLKTDPAYVHSNIISVTVLSKIVYTVTFSETGLPSGTDWFVNITNGLSRSSNTSKISFLEPNGTYSYSISTENKSYRTQLGTALTFTVSGLGISQFVVFLPVVYSVTFSEYGLTNGSRWFVNLTNGQSFSSTLSAISFSETNGTYHYDIVSSNKEYKPDQPSSAFIVSGSSVSQQVNFEEVTYSITFSVSNLATGVKWFVNLTNGQSFNSSKSSLIFSEPNGTYFYYIGTADKIFYAKGGSFLINGSSRSIEVAFLPYLYNISFVESGLPQGMKWNVTLNVPGSILTKSSTGTIFFNEVNGTYNFTIGSIQGFSTNNYEITIVINGSPFRSNVVWTPVTYPVTIVETGLASGETWSVTLTTMVNGQEKVYTLNSTSNTITFNVTNGSYSYTVSLPQGYEGSPVKSTISVVGSAVTTKLMVSAIPNYFLIWLVTGIAAILVAIILFYIFAGRRSLFKREGRFLKSDRRKIRK
ncbi:MAG: hypothetical protein AAE975_00830, partial [Thermoplasmatales archaeon]